MGIPRGPEDFVFVVPKGFDPGANVGGVLLGAVRDTPLSGKEDARQLGAELFLRVIGIAEAVAFVERWAVQTVWMAGPMREFVQRGPVVVGSTVEGLLARQVNRICRTAVVRSVALIVQDRCAGVLQNRFPGFNDLPLLPSDGGVRGNTVDLLCIENRVDPVNRFGIRASRAVL